MSAAYDLQEVSKVIAALEPVAINCYRRAR